VSLERRDLAVTIGAYGRTASIYNLVSQCHRFGLTVDAARKEIEQIVASVRTWRDHFRACSVSGHSAGCSATPRPFLLRRKCWRGHNARCGAQARWRAW
jgi:serine/threonine-protein kinase HipA